MAYFRRSNLVDGPHTRARNKFLKACTLFLLGASLSILLANADLVINPQISNSIAYIKQFFVTSDGTTNGTLGVILQGSGVFSTKYCNLSGTNCKTMENIAGLDDQAAAISGLSAQLSGYVTTGQLDTKLSTYFTGGQLFNILSGYMTVSQIDTRFNMFSGSIAASLSSYYTKSQINNLAIANLSGCANGETVKLTNGVWACATDLISSGLDLSAYVTTGQMSWFVWLHCTNWQVVQYIGTGWKCLNLASASMTWLIANGSWLVANGEYATAIWYNSLANWFGSAVMGTWDEANWTASIAMWNLTIASWDYSVAMWNWSQALWASSVSIWDANISSWNYSISMWDTSYALWDYSAAIGANNMSIGTKSMALGTHNISQWYASTTMGSNNFAWWDYSTALGFHTTSNAIHSLAIGAYNIWLTGSIFEVGIWTGDLYGHTSKNALTILSNGNVGIWLVAPTQKLEVAWSGKFSSGLMAPKYCDINGDSCFFPWNNVSTPGLIAKGGDVVASGDYSTAIGQQTLAGGTYSTAMGYLTYAGWYMSTAMGRGFDLDGSDTLDLNRWALWTYSTVMGWGTVAKAQWSTAIWTFNVWVANSIFEIGIWSVDWYYSVTPRNALTVLTGGNVGIGTTTPGYALDVSGSIKASTNIMSPSYCDADGNNCMSANTNYLTTEVDPKIRDLSQGSWCKAAWSNNGENTVIDCTADSPILTETDPEWNAVKANYPLTASLDIAGWDAAVSFVNSANPEFWDNAWIFVHKANNANTLTIDDTHHRVGIGTINPSQNLEVNGTGKFITSVYTPQICDVNGSNCVTISEIYWVVAGQMPVRSWNASQLYWASTCSNTNKWSIRFNDSNSRFEWCNGTQWVYFTQTPVPPLVPQAWVCGQLDQWGAPTCEVWTVAVSPAYSCNTITDYATWYCTWVYGWATSPQCVADQQQCQPSP